MGLSLQETEDSSPVDPTAFIHPQALVSNSFIGARTKVWQFASVIRGTHLGEDCVVASGATLDGPWFGDRCIISPGVDIGPGFLIGDDIFLGPNVVLCNDAWPCYSKDGFDAELLREDFVTVQIKNGASIGANAVVLPGVTIGKRAMVSAGAVVKTSVPDNHLFMRDGTLLKIKTEWRQRRMREAK